VKRASGWYSGGMAAEAHLLAIYEQKHRIISGNCAADAQNLIKLTQKQNNIQRPLVY
jgi:hypothetical protein